VSRRPLEAGEVISESDDELDEDWLKLRKNAEVNKLGLPGLVVRFLEIFDEFIHKEDPQSHIHLRDCIIRFAREHGAQLRHANVTNEFTKKLDELLEEHLISEEIHSAALEIVKGKKTNFHENNELSQRLERLDVRDEDTPLALADCGAHKDSVTKKGLEDRGQGTVRSTTGNFSPTTAYPDRDVEMGEVSLKMALDTTSEEDEELPWGLCYCGKDATATPSGSNFIACSGTVRFRNLKCQKLVH
jgi:hypothetical protein